LWAVTVDLGRGGPTTADVILAARLGEVEIHHHDLGVDDGLALLDDEQANRLLAALLRSYVRTREVPDLILEPTGRESVVVGSGGPVVAGPALDLVGWLSGRADGSALKTAGGLPPLPTW
jgi:maleylpyruvate isomerase